MGSEEVKRTCCLIVDNMCKVVEDPAAVVPVMPRLEPLVKAACEKIADPEARAVAERALATMRKAAEGSELKTVSAETAAEMLKAVCGDKMSSDAELFLPYVASLAASATNMRSYKPEAWKKSVALCEPFGDVIDDVRSKLELASKPAEEVEEDGTSGDVRRCMSPKEDAKKAKVDEANAVTPETCVNRRQKKKEKTFEYEVKWVFKPMESNVWVEKEILIKMGYIKIVQREDERQAAMAGLMTKQLTQQSIEKHLGDFGVDPESASHTQISQLSGGMRVKVVLAACMWRNPHVLILDEPTNYLDRDGLGALVLAVQDFKGGVLIISHNKEFCDSVATEKWIMKGGYLRIEGQSVDVDEEKGSGIKVVEDVFDGAGNKIDVQQNVAVSAKDAKKAIKDLEKKLKDGKKAKLLTDEEAWEIEDQITMLKDKLAKE